MLGNVFKRLFTHLHKHARQGSLGVPKAQPVHVERRDASELSVKEFFEDYAKPGRPVIITGLNMTEGEPWTLDFFKKWCNTTATPKVHDKKAITWGRLLEAEELPLPEFIDTFATHSTRRGYYLHDWSLPQNCKEVFGPPPYRGFTVPKYFAGDYFQRSAFDGYQHSWPSLFIGSEETVR